ncbi:uncharacterized protein FOMMEDRAFT_150925 [Fomitiporia mediterranea MF3/22]|uniref:uncharacterized protein n=1 Tax=Fomitiporia mediterranea (strain MF3/22) TaxID=694068 RepID=UPI000440806A|nr:uncharacterized protein FOMMEDRAFT_150925 [Fomitiporia mediterranea MF3/22]EJD08206.1 hypothetical protein FOMMEDRAFT_150925 [Fomitiporia mediterranea MF3/22]
MKEYILKYFVREYIRWEYNELSLFVKLHSADIGQYIDITEAYFNSNSQRIQGMQDVGMKVLRVWLDGQSTATTKGTTITEYPSLEPNQIGVFNDKTLVVVSACSNID